MSLILLGFLVLFVCWLWLVVRSARLGTLPLVLALFAWPLLLIEVIQNRKDPERDIARPYFAVLIAAVALYACAQLWLNSFIQQIDDNVAVAQARKSQRDAWGNVQPESELAARIRLRQALARIRYDRGTKYLAPAHATLEIPRHFRFASRGQLVAAGMGELADADDDLLGLLVHESVDLAADDAWVVQVLWYPIGHVKHGDAQALGGETLLPDAQRVVQRLAEAWGEDFRLDKFAHEPTWHPEHAALVWGEAYYYPEERETLHDCHAVRPGRAGVLTFLVENVPVARSELCLRSARLMAARTAFDAGHDHGDFSFWRDRRSGHALADLVTGAAFE